MCVINAQRVLEVNDNFRIMTTINFLFISTYGMSDNMQKNFGLTLYFMGEFLLCSRRPGFVDA